MTIHQRSVAVSLLLASLACAGCGGGPPNPQPGPATPHSGALSAIPDGQGYVEVLKAPAPGNKKMTQVSLFFLDADKKPVSSPPPSATLKLFTATPPIEFKPITGDPTKEGGLISTPFLDRDDMSGNLTASINGTSMTIPLTIR
jgi:hypothetical protein